MDRLIRALLAGRLALLAGGLIVSLGGCRSTRSEVPPGKPYQTTGTPPTVGFSSEPHPSTAAGMAGLYGNKGPGGLVPDGRGTTSSGSDVIYGTVGQAPGSLGTPTDHRYAAPGTSPSSPSGSAGMADALLKSMPSASQTLAKDPAATPASGTSSPGGAYP